MKIKIVDGLTCPKCNAPELIPHTASPDGSWQEGARWAIRPFKIDDWSECLRCSGVLDANFEPTGNKSNGNGWFRCV